LARRTRRQIDPFTSRDDRVNFVAVPAEVDVLEVLLLGDLHAGHKCHSEELLDYYLKKLKESPYMRCILLGDLFECLLRTSKGKPSHQIMPIPEQRHYLVEKLGPIVDRIDASVPGNHEERQSNEGGDDIMEVLMNEIGCKNYFDPIGLVVYSSQKRGKAAYTVGVRHGSSNGTLIGSGLNATVKDVFNMQADVYVEGHCHKCTEGPRQGVLKPDFHNQCGVTSIYKVITNGSLLDPRRSYAEMKGYPNCMPEQGILRLDMRKNYKSIEMVRV